MNFQDDYSKVTAESRSPHTTGVGERFLFDRSISVESEFFRLEPEAWFVGSPQEES